MSFGPPFGLVKFFLHATKSNKGGKMSAVCDTIDAYCGDTAVVGPREEICKNIRGIRASGFCDMAAPQLPSWTFAPAPTLVPTLVPTFAPTLVPTFAPTVAPTVAPKSSGSWGIWIAVVVALVLLMALARAHRAH